MKYFFGLIFIIFAASSFAEDAYVHGKDRCYYFNTPTGWVADNRAGEKSGVPIVLYPKGGSWERSPIVIYTTTSTISTSGTTAREKIQAQVDRTVRDFKSNGSPKHQAQFLRAFTNRNGHFTEIWQYTGDKWGNTELVAYFLGKHSINFFVLSAKKKTGFEKAEAALMELAGSYREADDCVPCEAKPREESCGKNSQRLDPVK